MKTWKKVPWLSTHEVSDLGDVRSLVNTRGNQSNVPRLLKPSIRMKPKPYRYVKLKDQRGNYRDFKIARLVLEAFVGTAQGRVARHLNDISTDDRLENLAWGTQAENLADAQRNRHKQGMQKLTADDVHAIRASSKGSIALAKHYGVSRVTIHKIKTRRSWRAIK